MNRKNLRKSIAGFSPETRKVFLYCCISPEFFFPSTQNITNRLKLEYTTTHYHITKLRHMGLIDKQNQLTIEGKKLYKFIMGWDKNNLENCPKRLRAHNLQIAFKVTKANKNYEEFSTIYQPFTNNRYKGIKAELYNCTVMYYHPGKIVATIPDMFANTDEEIALSLTSVVADLKSALEKEFDIVIGSHKICKVTTMHIAVINSIVAEALLLQGKTFRSDKIHIDGSHDNKEIEAVDPNTALQDVEWLVKIEDLARETESLRIQLKEAESLLKKNRIDYEQTN